jgi:hypothetical protein
LGKDQKRRTRLTFHGPQSGFFRHRQREKNVRALASSRRDRVYRKGLGLARQ